MMPPQTTKWKLLFMRYCLIGAFALILTGCSGFLGFPGVYRINVEQGNIVTQEMVDQLKPGMNRRQVRYVLGTPLVKDTFNQNRWDYVYSMTKGDKELAENRLSVYFENDKLVRFTGDWKPEQDNKDEALIEAAAKQAE